MVTKVKSLLHSQQRPSFQQPCPLNTKTPVFEMGGRGVGGGVGDKQTNAPKVDMCMIAGTLGNVLLGLSVSLSKSGIIMPIVFLAFYQCLLI